MAALGSSGASSAELPALHCPIQRDLAVFEIERVAVLDVGEHRRVPAGIGRHPRAVT